MFHALNNDWYPAITSESIRWGQDMEWGYVKW